MQANKASREMTEELARWLQTPAAGQVAMSRGAIEDLASLRQAKDLSIVSIDPEKRVEPSSSVLTPESKHSARNRTGGFLALFSCAGKRR